MPKKEWISQDFHPCLANRSISKVNNGFPGKGCLLKNKEGKGKKFRDRTRCAVSAPQRPSTHP